jgi:hypothetical protein
VPGVSRPVAEQQADREDARQDKRSDRQPRGTGFGPARGTGDARTCQCRIMPEDPLLQRTHIGAGLQPEFVHQPGTRRVEHCQGIRLAACLVQREHQRRHQPFPRRMLSYELLKLGHQRRTAAAAQLSLDA